MNYKFIHQGDLVDILFPGTAASFDEAKKIKNFINKIKLTPRIFYEKEQLLRKPVAHEFPSFSAFQRFEQLKETVESNDSRLIWCGQGGYGSAEIIPFLQKMKKPKKQKIFIGFSDISSLNKILIEEWKWHVVSAPMLAQIVRNKVSQKSIETIVDFIFGKKKELRYKLNILNQYATEDMLSAPVTGGCASVLAGSFGTKNQLDWHNKILFLEDEGEDGERLDRYFYQLVQIIAEQKKYPRAILLGNFMEANPHGTPKGKNIRIAIKKLAEKLAEKNLRIPLFEEKTKCLGHSKNMMPLLLGAEAKIAEGVLVQKII